MEIQPVGDPTPSLPAYHALSLAELKATATQGKIAVRETWSHPIGAIATGDFRTGKRPDPKPYPR